MSNPQFPLLSAFAVDGAKLGKTAINAIRIGLGLSGLVMLAIGIAMVVAPKDTAQVLTVLLAIYLLVAGIAYLGTGVFARGISGGARALELLLGVLFVIAAIVAFSNVGATTLALAAFIGILVGVLWIIEGVVSLVTAGDRGSRGWTIFFGILSIFAGIVLLFSPLWGFVVLFVFTGVSLIVIGIFQIIRAFTFGRAARA